MSDRDNELDELLRPLAQLKPTGLQVKRWQTLTLRDGVNSRSEWRMRLIQLTAAACVGFIVGALLFKNHNESQELANNFDASATIESVYINSN